MEGTNISPETSPKVDSTAQFAAAMRGQVIGGGGIEAATEMAKASGLSVQDSVQISSAGYAMAAAAADTE